MSSPSGFNREELLDLLRNNRLEVTFTKADGTERVLRGTLLENYLPTYEQTGEITRVRETVSVWDLEKEAWRSFRPESVKSVKIIEP